MARKSTLPLRKRRFSQSDCAKIAHRFRHFLDEHATAALDKMRHERKITLNSDDLFLLCREYEANPNQRATLGPQLYATARRFIDRTYKQLLARRPRTSTTVVFTAGGSATGKSTILRAAGKRSGVDFLVDTTFSDTERALAQIDRALQAGRKVEVYFVHRDFRDCVISMLARAQRAGRLVPIDDMARTHYGAPRAVLAALEKYQEDKRVLIRLFKNEGSRRLSQLTLRDFESAIAQSVDDLRDLGESVLDEFCASSRRKGQSRSRHNQNSDVRRKDVRIPFAILKAARSKAKKTGATARKGYTRPR